MDSKFKNSNTEYTNFVFYGSWRNTLEGFREDFGEDYAREALWNLMLMATAGDIETDKKSIVGFVQGSCMPNITAAQERYERAQNGGQKGGRPKLLSNSDDLSIAALRKSGLTAAEIGKKFGVSDKTVRRSDGWINWQKYVQMDKTDKTEDKTQKPDIDIYIDIEKYKEKDILSNEFGEDKTEETYLTPDDYFTTAQIHDIDLLYSQNKSAAEIAGILNIDEDKLIHHWVWREQPDKPEI